MLVNVKGCFERLYNRFSFIFVFLAIVSWIFILLSYYIRFGEDLMPLGWDASYYMVWMKTAATEPPLEFIMERRKSGFRILYPYITSIFIRLGVDSAVVELFFPIVLSLLLVLTLSLFVKRIRGGRIGVLTAFFSLSWYGLYCLTSNYHANMLALTLMLSAAWLLFQENSSKKRYLAYFLVFLASITHPTTSVFALIFVLALVFLFRFDGKKKYLLDAAIIALLSTPSLSFFTKRAQPISGAVVYSEVFVLNILHEIVISMGVIFPVTLIGFITLANIARKGNWKDVREYAVFVACWAMASMVASVLYIFFPYYEGFKRIVMLAPSPILLAEGVNFLVSIFRRLPTFRDMSKQFLAIGITSIILVPSICIVYNEASIHFRSYISYDAYQKLKWLAQNMRTDTPPIFIVYGAGVDSIFVGELCNNLITATVGDHYTYLGRVDFFLTLLRMPFVNARGERFSRRFFNNLRSYNLLDWDALQKYQIIVVDDFYLPHGLPSYYKETLFDEIHDGIYLFNLTKFFQLKRIYVPLYYTSENHTFGWYWIERDWATFGYVAEYYNPNPQNTTSYYEIFISLPESGDYVFEFRFFDGTPGCGFVVKLNGSVVASITYNGTSSPVVYDNIVVEGVDRGVYRLVIEPFGSLYYASLDYFAYELI